MAQEKKPHLRKCVGCGQMKDKRELIRVCRFQDGSVGPDETGRLNGRGAYLCRNAECLEKARKTRGLERSLRCRIDASVYDMLREYDGQ